MQSVSGMFRRRIKEDSATKSGSPKLSARDASVVPPLHAAANGQLPPTGKSSPAGGTARELQSELAQLRQAKTELEKLLIKERESSFDLRNRLASMQTVASSSRGLPVQADPRRAAPSSSLADEDDDDVIYAEDDSSAISAMLMRMPPSSTSVKSTASRPLGKDGRPVLQKSASIVSKRRLSNMQGGVLRRGEQQTSNARSADVIAKMLGEHLKSKRETDVKLGEVVEANTVEIIPPMAATTKKSTAASLKAPTPAPAPAPVAPAKPSTPSAAPVPVVLPSAPPKQPAAAPPTAAPAPIPPRASEKKKSSSSSTDVGSRSSRRMQSGEMASTKQRTPSFLGKVLAHKSTARHQAEKDAIFAQRGPVIQLNRGGVYVNTSVGAVQFGMPPETIKDSMDLGTPVPSIFVVPPERFNLHEGVNVAEVEFPAFFNFFVLRQKVRLVTYRETVEDLRAIMQEALLGPTEENLFVEQEYSKFAPASVYAARANLLKEMEYFAAPRAPDFYKIGIDNLIDFEFFDESGFCDLGGGVTIQDDLREGFVIKDAGSDPRKRMGSKGEDAETDAASEGTAATASSPSELYVTYDQASSCMSVPPSLKASAEAGETGSFVIPLFGLTVLGNSHGFDAEGATSGFVVWVNGQGIMVDPPPHSTMLLLKAGIQPKSITAILLTHCHADHEVGTIQKLVTEDKITLMTTVTVFESFIRKYEAVTGLAAEFLRRLVHFRPVYLEEPTYWNGASFRFFYSLHSIPCVGFHVNFKDKSLVYSADTYYDPEGLRSMHEAGVLSDARLQALLNFPWHSDVVLHEMGVPPIHTPLEALEKLPEKVRQNIHLIHIGGKTARDAKKRGFKIATPGVEHTIVLVPAPDNDDPMLKFYQLISSMDIFRGFTLTQALELWFMAKAKTYKTGMNIVEKGALGDDFMIILSGSASVDFGGSRKVFRPGDYLGEVSVVTGAPRTATIRADETVVTFEVDRYAFDFLVMHDPRLKIRMTNLIRARSDGSWNAIALNSLLSRFTSAQKTQLQALLTARQLKRGDVVWSKDEDVRIGALVSKGGLRFVEVHGELKDSDPVPQEGDSPLVPGMFVFDMLGTMNDEPLTTTLVAEMDGTVVFTFETEAIMGYLEQNPLLLLGLLKSVVIV